jgi:hypothetical protein
VGSRNGRSANTVVLKHFVQMLHLTKTDGGTFDNAKACFDRIIAANLRSRQLGCQPRCITHADLLLNATYAVKTRGRNLRSDQLQR